MKKVYIIIFTIFIIDIAANPFTNQEELIYLECKENKTIDPWIIIFEMYKPDKDNCKGDSLCKSYNTSDLNKLRVVANKEYIHRTYFNQDFHPEPGFALGSVDDECIPHNGILIDHSLEKRESHCSGWKEYEYVTSDAKTYNNRSIYEFPYKIRFTVYSDWGTNGSDILLDRTNLSAKRDYQFTPTGESPKNIKSIGQCNITSKNTFDNLYDEIFNYRKNIITEIIKKKKKELKAREI